MSVRSRAPVDADGQIIQVLGVLQDGAHHEAVGVTTARNSVAFNSDTRAIEIYSDVDCYFQTGDSSITASSSDHFLPAERERVYALGGDKKPHHTHLAWIRAVGDGIIHISEMD